ncbi:MAG: M48 family metallopeptidase [Pararhodobacter sp.]
MADTETALGDPPLQVLWRRSARARRLSLRVSRLDGRITLTVPKSAPARTAEAFLQEREAWLRQVLADLPLPCDVVPGVLLPYQGTTLRLCAEPLRQPRIEGNSLLVPRRGAAGRSARAFFQLRARDRLVERVSYHASALGRPAGRIALRDTRSRWGSCSAAGDLMFSWRLIMAPPEVLDYVAAHEVAHLAQMNHSPAFWAEVRRLVPGYAAPRRWLREHGSTLHRFRFDP